MCTSLPLTYVNEVESLYILVSSVHLPHSRGSKRRIQAKPTEIYPGLPGQPGKLIAPCPATGRSCMQTTCSESMPESYALVLIGECSHPVALESSTRLHKCHHSSTTLSRS